jgi:hypothetical protein
MSASLIALNSVENTCSPPKFPKSLDFFIILGRWLGLIYRDDHSWLEQVRYAIQQYDHPDPPKQFNFSGPQSQMNDN